MQQLIRSLTRLALIGWAISTWNGVLAEPTGLFSDKAGRFAIAFPGEPKHDTTEVGKAKEVQHQFTLPSDSGAYLVSYQDNPNLQGADAKRIQEALLLGQQQLEKAFGGTTENGGKSIVFNKQHPGRDMIIPLPAAGGTSHCRMFMVGTRLYQLMVIGKPEFVNSPESEKFLNSFQLLAPTNAPLKAPPKASP